MPPRFLLLALVAALAVPAAAPAGEGREPGDALLLAIAAWVAETTELPMPRVLPEIRLDDPQDMPRLMRGGGPSPAGAPSPGIVAFYDSGARAIHLPAGWSAATPAELSVLVHEMVHHAQAEAGRRFACPAERERAAYEAQARWLALFGTDLSREFGIDRVFLRVATACGMP